MEFWLWVFVVVSAVVGLTIWRRHARWNALMAKYGAPEVVRAILRHDVWQGMTQEQLIDSRGRPAAVDERVYKTKTTRVFKYDQDGRKRFATRITVENGAVVGWNQR
ncbi:MAG: hypothetical protein J7515_09120 [Caulobacter sp.]|nr:hypothetical protein [Caulobacter sp.]